MPLSHFPLFFTTRAARLIFPVFHSDRLYAWFNFSKIGVPVPYEGVGSIPRLWATTEDKVIIWRI